MSARADVVVIGAGSNGLAAASVLARAGRKVVVLERAGSIGGQYRLREFAPGFQMSLKAFDTGWISPAVAAATRVGIPQHTSPEISISVHDAAAQRMLSLPVNVTQAAAVLGQSSEKDGKLWGTFAEFVAAQKRILEQLYQLGAPSIESSSASELLPLASVAIGLRLGKNGADRVGHLLRTLPLTANDFAAEWFESSTLRAAIAAGGVQGIKQGPRSGGTTFVLLHHLVGATDGSIRARPFTTESPDAFVAALAKSVLEGGGAIATNSAAKSVVIDNYAVKGVETETGEVIACDSVVAATDPRRAMLDLIDPEWLDPDLRHSVSNIRMRGCTAFVSYALKELPDTLSSAGPAALGSIISLSSTADAIEKSHDEAKYQRLAEWPHVELIVPSMRWKNLASGVGQSIIARVHHVPFDADNSEIGACADAALDRAFPGFPGRVLHRECLSPRDIEREYGITEGALSHGELGLDQVLFMRPTPQLASYSTPIEGLFLSGAGCHPGPGLPGAAGVLTAGALLRSSGSSRK